MRLLVELSGEHPALARAEVLGALAASGRSHRLLFAEERLLGVETDADPSWLGGRLALANNVDELIAWGAIETVLDAARSVAFADRTFRVRVNSYRGCHEKLALEKQLGGLVTGPVDLTSPDEEVRLLEGEQHYLARRVVAIDRRAFERRKVAERAFVQPISVHPRFARVLVNLAGVREGDRILDPFCGTGGILLEAGLVGARLLGGDIREDMVDGCRRALGEFQLAAKMLVGDVEDLAAKFGGVDAIVTDPPYGRATSTRGEPLASLYARALAAAGRILRPGRRLAMIVPDPGLAATKELEFVESHALRVHKSLTRHFVVMRRES